MSTEAGTTEAEEARKVQSEVSLTGLLGKLALALARLVRARTEKEAT